VDRAVAKADYDPARAAALLQEAGFARSGDGMVRDQAGNLLTVPLLSQPENIDVQQATVVADNWKSLGVNAELSVLTRGQQRDREYRSKREALLVQALTAMAADAVVNPTHLQPRAMAFQQGLTGPRQPWQEEYALIWNAWEWTWQ
jgi:ABC-type transport system substrate-binding protein